jgi:hypothetical protein
MNAVATMSVPIAGASRGAAHDPQTHEPGGACCRRALSAPPGARTWLIEMVRGSAWPRAERTGTDGRLFGFSLEPEAYLAAGGDPATLSGRLHLQQG